MARRPKTEKRLPRNRFYHSPKISEYQFKRVLWSFVLDEPVAEAATHINLSPNSINAIYGRLQVFFTEIGVFRDIYGGGDPREGAPEGEDFEGFEFRLLDFHLKRVKRKRRLKHTTLDEVDYNWCESFWRFHYNVLMDARPSEAVPRMMYSHLLAQIRLCGPIGSPPTNSEKSARLNHEHFNQRIRWLELNSPAFKDEVSRAALREFRLRPFEPVQSTEGENSALPTDIEND